MVPQVTGIRAAVTVNPRAFWAPVRRRKGGEAVPCFSRQFGWAVEPPSLQKQPGSPITELLSVRVFLSARNTVILRGAASGHGSDCGQLPS